AHGDGDFDLLTVEGVQSFRPMRGEVVADFLHGLDCFWVDLTGWPRPGAEGFDFTRTMDSSERLGHLAPVGVLDAEKNNFSHAVLRALALFRHSCRMPERMSTPQATGFSIQARKQGPQRYKVRWR